MLKYFAKRTCYLGFVAVILSFIIFSLYSLVPSNRAYTDARAEVQKIKNLGEEEREEKFNQLYLEYQRLYGTDTKNIFIRYLRWLGVVPKYDGVKDGLIQGNFGYSYEKKVEVKKLIAEPMKNTVLLNAVAIVLGLFITFPLGKRCARGGLVDKLVQGVSALGYSVPTFIVAILFIWLFSWNLGLPAVGTSSPGVEGNLLDKIRHLVLPVAVMTFGTLGMAKYVKNAYLKTQNEEYITTARAKGLDKKLVSYHVWRNASLLLLPLIVGWLLSVFSGSVIVEKIFGLNGMGNLMINSLGTGDYDVVIFMQTFYVLISLVGNLVVDLAYCVLDPRVRLQ